MPTSKPRYTLTDTGELSDLLDAAQRRWPKVADRKALLLQLAATGGETIAAESGRRRAAVADIAGVLSGVYEPGELERLREDWSE
jgi:sulfite reductase beta subunit-like hemoprotein